MVEMDPGKDPWLENEAERRTLDYGGSFPNPRTLVRARTRLVFALTCSTR